VVRPTIALRVGNQHPLLFALACSFEHLAEHLAILQVWSLAATSLPQTTAVFGQNGDHHYTPAHKLLWPYLDFFRLFAPPRLFIEVFVYNQLIVVRNIILLGHPSFVAQGKLHS